MVILTEAEYQEAVRRVKQDQQLEIAQRAALVDMGLTSEEVERGMEPLITFNMSFADDVQWYENACQGNLPVIRSLTAIGQLLIAARISRYVTQRDLAERLGVSESIVSRDERNTYHGISVERAQKILDALNVRVEVWVEHALQETPSPDRELIEPNPSDPRYIRRDSSGRFIESDPKTKPVKKRMINFIGTGDVANHDPQSP